MMIKFLFIYFAILVPAFAYDYSKCSELVNENRVTYETKNCSLTLCLIQFSCDFGTGPILMNAACRITGKANQCPSIQECINDSTVEFIELDIAPAPNNSSNSSSVSGQKSMGL